MNLPLDLSYAPMEAITAKEIPEGPQWQYEPKWDGFGCLAFRDGAEVALQSKAGQPLARYFPEVAAELRELQARRFLLDGEIVVPADGKLSFDDLLQRIHPAASRIRTLSEQTPAKLMVFDLLVVEVQYDHFTGGRFRHGTRLLRWRHDKAPAQCTLEQLDA